MSEEFELIARHRARTGTGLVRRLRREGDVPAILYGAGKENLAIAVNHDVLYHSLDREDFHSAVITINTDGNKEQAILKDVQRHPHKVQILHADFQRVDASKPITMTLPIHFVGEDDCVGVKSDGGILSKQMNDVEVTCLPKDLPDNIELDVSGLHLGEAYTLSEISLPEGVQFTAFTHGDIEEHDQNVVTVMAPRVEVEPEDEAETDDLDDTESTEDDASGEESSDQEDDS